MSNIVVLTLLAVATIFPVSKNVGLIKRNYEENRYKNVTLLGATVWTADPTPQPTPTISYPPSTKGKAPPSAQALPQQIDCIGPDYNTFRTTWEECKKFSEKWGIEPRTQQQMDEKNAKVLQEIQRHPAPQYQQPSPTPNYQNPTYQPFPSASSSPPCPIYYASINQFTNFSLPVEECKKFQVEANQLNERYYQNQLEQAKNQLSLPYPSPIFSTFGTCAYGHLGWNGSCNKVDYQPLYYNPGH